MSRQKDVEQKGPEERIVAPQKPGEADGGDAAQNSSGGTAKDVNVVRGDDHPQAGRHPGD